MKDQVTAALLYYHRKNQEWVSLKEIYDKVEEIRGVPNANNGASIRAALETHCKDSAAFRGEELYISKGIGTGLYKSIYYNFEKVVYEITEIEQKVYYDMTKEIAELEYKEGIVNIRKHKKTDRKNIRTKKPDYVAEEVVKNIQGAINEKKVFELELERLMKEEAKEQVKEMKDFFNNKKENEGYDILSFELDENGKYVEKYIEVKSTKSGEGTPIDITAEEIAFAENHIDNYYLYRIYNSDSKNQQYKIIRGKELLNKTIYNLVPSSYKIYLN